jgi:hypothetical protein
MKNHTDALKSFLVPVLAFFLAGCSNLFLNKPAEPAREIPDGKGAVRWSVETQTARTLFPALPFTKYELTFTAPGKTAVTETFTAHTGELTLETGRWELSVSASIGNDPVAQGSAPVEVRGGQTNSVTVILRGTLVSGTGTGTLAYNVTLPAVLLYGELSVAALDEGGFATTIPLPLSPSSGSINLPDGYYVLAFSFFKTTQRAVITDLAHVYDGSTTNGAYDFSDAPFVNAPEIDMPSGGAVILINSAAELAAIAGDIGNAARNNGKNAYLLNNDIDLSAYSPWNPLGGDHTPFAGYFFGEGHAIRGLELPDGSALDSYIGLFGKVENTRIENFNVEITDTEITLSSSNSIAKAGIIAGSGSGVLKDLRISVVPGGEFAVTGGNDELFAGGLAGTFSGTIERCGFVGNVAIVSGASESNIGGLVGEFTGDQISESYMAGTITNTNTNTGAYINTGGLAGLSEALEDCYHNGDIVVSCEPGSTMLTGGLCAMALVVSRSYTTGSLVSSGGNGYTAGIFADGGASVIENSASLNLAISGPSSLRIGNDDNYSIGGMYNANNYALNAMLVNGAVLTDAASDPQDDVNGLGKTKAELQTQSTYQTGLGWDFEAVWEMGPASYPYPILKWQKGQVDLPDGYGLIKLPEDLVMEFTSLSALSGYLATLPQNSALDPYPVKLSGLMISNFADAVGDPLGELFSAFNGKYVNLDLSACTGASIADVNNSVLTARPDKAMPVSILLPSALTSIGSAFRGCSSLVSIDIPTGVTTINGAFVDCSSLVSVNIPAGVATIGGGSFSGCSSLVSIDIPEGITIIHDSTFKNCSSLVSIKLPSTLVSIGDSPSSAGVFEGCSSLVSINIPADVTTIGRYTFRNCSALVSINIPSGVSIIEDWAFRWCSSLASIDIPAGVVSIDDYAFWNCDSFTSVICRASTPPSLGSYAFPASLQSIQVPAASVSAYKTDSGWSGYADIITAIP